MALELKKPSELPAAVNVSVTAAIPVDNGVAVEKATPKQIVDAGRPIASEAQAITGTNNTASMTPLTTKQAMDYSGASAIAKAQAWAESPTAPGVLGTKSAKTWAEDAASFVGPRYKTVVLMQAATDIPSGKSVRVDLGYNGEPEMFVYDAASAATADGAIIVTPATMPGRFVSTRMEFNTSTEMIADPRRLTAYDRVKVGGVSLEATPLGTGWRPGYPADYAQVRNAGGQGFVVMTDWAQGASITSFGAGRPGSTDDTVFIQECFDAVFSTRGIPHAAVSIPPGIFLTDGIDIGDTSGLDNDRAAVHKNIFCSGELRGDNTSRAIVHAAGLFNCTIQGLKVTNTSKNLNSRALKIARAYGCTFIQPITHGGYFGIEFDGNLNGFYGGLVTGSYLGGFAITDNTNGNVNNSMREFNIDGNDRHGIYIAPTGGTFYADLLIERCYFEANGTANPDTSAHILIGNNPGNVEVRGNYLNMNTLRTGIGLTGDLINPKYCMVGIHDNLFGVGPGADFGTGTGSHPFNAAAIMAGSNVLSYPGLRYSGNKLAKTDGPINPDAHQFGFTKVYSGSPNSPVWLSVNDDGARRLAPVKNGNFAALTGAAGTLPADWLDASDPDVITSAATISPYGDGNAIVIPIGVATQNIKVRPRTNYKIEYTSQSSAATEAFALNIFTTDFLTALHLGKERTNTAPATFSEYWYSGANTEVSLFLQKQVHSGSGNVRVSDIRMTDMSH